MGQENKKISTRIIQPKQLIRKQPVEVGVYIYPFKQFSSFQFDDQSQTFLLTLQKPYEDRIKLNTTIYQELQKAVFQKTFDIRLQHVLFDTFNFDKNFYIGCDHQTPITMTFRKFKDQNGHLHKNILYEQHLYETINKFQCPNLIKLNDAFVINSNMQQELPWTHFFIFQSLQVNLSQIIRYRRQNNCEWFMKEFQKLCWDLSQALNELHTNNITHNDIRPCNIYYSIEKECYVLGEFSNSLKTDPNGTFLNVKTKTHPSFMMQEKQLKTQNLKQTFINHKRADIYSLGITLLCAFYMVEPVQRKYAAPINRKMEENHDIIKIIRKMVHKSQYPLKISQIKDELEYCNKSSDMKYLVQSIKFRQKPKNKQLLMIFSAYSQAYKRMGLWQQWRECLYHNYDNLEGSITKIQEVQLLKELSRVQKIMQNFQQADTLGQKAVNIYYQIGIKYQKQGNITQSLKVLHKGLQTLKYCRNQNKIVLVKILQTLSLLHAQKHLFEQSLACLNQSKKIMNKTFSDDIKDFYQIYSQQAKIHQILGNFQQCQKILKKLLQQAKIQQDYSQQIEFLKRLGKNQIKRAEYKKEQTFQISENKIGSPLMRRSQSTSIFMFNRIHSQKSIQIKDDKIQTNEIFQKAQDYFLLASKLIKARFEALKGSITVKEYASIQSQSLQIQNLITLKHLGEIKYKQNNIERAQDYFYKVLSSLDKLLRLKQQQQNPQKCQKNDHNQVKQVKKRKVSQFNDQSSDQISIKSSLSSLRENQIDQNQQSIVKPYKKLNPIPMNNKKNVQGISIIMNQGDLMKTKGDIECQIALCKQYLNQYDQMLTFYNRSLNSYKSYYGTFHNKLCGIIIGSMAVGYQKTNQYNKAISCVQLANQILKDILPQNSPDLKHFSRVKLQIINDQNKIYKKVQDKNNIYSSQNLIGQLHPSVNGFKRKQTKRKSKETGSSKSIMGQSIGSSIDVLNKLKQIEQEKASQMRMQLEECHSQKMSDTSSLREVQLPLKVSYYKNSQKLQYKSNGWQLNLQSSQIFNEGGITNLGSPKDFSPITLFSQFKKQSNFSV